MIGQEGDDGNILDGERVRDPDDIFHPLVEQVRLLTRQDGNEEGVGGVRGGKHLVHNVVGAVINVVLGVLGNGGRDS